MSDTQNDPFVGGSSLAKALGNASKPAVKTFSLGGRLTGVTFAVKWVPASVRVESASLALKTCLETFKLDRTDLYGETGEAVLELETKVQLLFRAMCDPQDSNRPMAASPDEIRQLLDPDEVTLAYNEWLSWQLERSPLHRAKSLQEVERIVDDLGKGYMPTTFLKSCEPDSLRAIAISLADRLAKLTKHNSSRSGQPSEHGGESIQAT